jgi:hypothetical protein
VLGNPPWDRIKLQEQEFFATRDAEIAQANNKALRQKLIDTLPERNPTLFRDFADAKRRADGQSKFVRTSERFPLTAVGDVNVYPLFAEHDRKLLRERGRAGVIVPTGIATDNSTKDFFQDLAATGQLRGLNGYENEERIFPAVHHVYKFCTLVVGGSNDAVLAELVFFCRKVEDTKDERRRFSLTAEEFALLNPNTLTCPIFRTRVDAELTKAIHRRVPVLVDESSATDPWSIDFLRMFDLANDSGLFRTEPAPGLIPLYEAKLFHQFDHRYSTYAGATQEQLNLNVLPRLESEYKANPSATVQPRYWVEQAKVDARLQNPNRRWLLVFRDIARATDERTAIFTILPRVALEATRCPSFCQTRSRGRRQHYMGI